MYLKQISLRVAAPRREAGHGGGRKQTKADKKTSGGYHELRDGHQSGGRAAGARTGFGDKVVLLAGEIPIGGVRFCLVSRVGRREYHLEPADEL